MIKFIFYINNYSILVKYVLTVIALTIIIKFYIQLVIANYCRRIINK